MKIRNRNKDEKGRRERKSERERKKGKYKEISCGPLMSKYALHVFGFKPF
jgi:hypothetical protein